MTAKSMEWGSKEGLVLLRRAFPSGVLPVRGVSTLGGWTVTSVVRTPQSQHRVGLCRDLRDFALLGCEPERAWVLDAGRELSRGTAGGLLAGGHFLPVPDPEGTATWAALLKVLTDLLGWKSAPHDVPVEAYKPRPIWGRALQRDIRGVWSIAAYGRVAGRSRSLTRALGRWANTDDPSIVLIRAIAFYRELEKA